MKLKTFLCLLLPVLAIAVACGSGLTDMRGLALKHVKLPFYKEQKLQLVAFTESGKRMDQIMYCNDMFLDVLLENADVDRIPDGWKTALYPLDAKLPQVLEFWKKRHTNSKSVILTSRCSINQGRNEAYGDDPVFVRSPMLDLNGVGFNADFKNSVILINSDVHIVARKSDADPRKLLTGTPLPAAYNRIFATSDTLRMDMANNEIMLIGNVHVIDGDSTLTCDRLTVFMENDKKSAPAVQVESVEPMLKGVSRVLADGNVVMVKKPADPADKNGMQTATGDHLEYEVRSGIIALTGAEHKPTVTQGKNDRISGSRIEILRDKNKVFVTGSCRVESVTRDADGKNSGTRVITARRGDFDSNTNVSTFNENVVATDKDTSLYCHNMRIYISKAENKQDVERIFAQGNVKVVSRSEKSDPAAKNGKKNVESTIVSRQAELNYLVNKLIFYQDVKVRDEASKLDCDRLDIFLVDKKAQAQQVASSPIGGGMGGKDKSISKIVAAGRVFMKSKKDDISTDLLTLFFRDLPPGVKPSPGMFQSGGVQLTEILCDGAVVANSVEKDGSVRSLKAAHAKSDLLRDYSEFHKDVVIFSGGNEIFCRDMYVFTVRSSRDGKKQPPQSQKPALDADPFALDMGENAAPARIAVSKDLDLTRIVCRNEVVLVRRYKGGLQRAGGDEAVYNVNKKELVLTAKPPRRPWLRSDGRKQFCDIIRSDMETEELRGIGNVMVMPDDGK
ncbi:MAG: hypothetical protein IJW35_04860 [Lentisphaeria bacterium]|nr:hypothetical protein [Lentisphaeria bacterium]